MKRMVVDLVAIKEHGKVGFSFGGQPVDLIEEPHDLQPGDVYRLEVWRTTRRGRIRGRILQKAKRTPLPCGAVKFSFEETPQGTSSEGEEGEDGKSVPFLSI